MSQEAIIANDSSKLQQSGMVTVPVGVKAIASDSDLQTALVASGARLTVVQFTTAGSEPCVGVGPAVNTLSSRYPDVSFLQVDVQTCQAMAALHRVSATTTPTFLFFRDGLRVDRYEGVDAAALELKIGQHVVRVDPPSPSVPEGHDVDQAHLVNRVGCQEKIIDDDDDSSKVKEGLVMVLKCVAAISTAATVVNPIFGVAGSLIRLVLNHVDDEDTRKLKREFAMVNRALDQLSQQNSSALLQIKKETLDGQYFHVEQNLKSQFQKYMEMLEAQPKHRDSKKVDFKESYYGGNNLGDQNLHTLYDGVVGTRKLFSQPILEVYLKHSQGDLPTMERLCARLKILFCIGLIALMGYAAIVGDDEEGLMEEWSEKMMAVQEKMQGALKRCK